jgi:hypothetical protein
MKDSSLGILIALLMIMFCLHLNAVDNEEGTSGVRCDLESLGRSKSEHSAVAVPRAERPPLSVTLPEAAKVPPWDRSRPSRAIYSRPPVIGRPSDLRKPAFSGVRC